MRDFYVPKSTHLVWFRQKKSRFDRKIFLKRKMLGLCQKQPCLKWAMMYIESKKIYQHAWARA
jgi:hypothetical protein